MQKKLNRINDLLNSGDLYAGVDDELITYQHELVERLNQFNSTPDYILSRQSMQTGGLKMSMSGKMLFSISMCVLWMMPIFLLVMTV